MNKNKCEQCIKKSLFVVDTEKLCELHTIEKLCAKIKELEQKINMLIEQVYSIENIT